MVDTVEDFEISLKTYLRNNVTDPSSRGTVHTDTFTATASQTVFTLSEYLVKTITSVTVNTLPVYIGHDYYVTYGEGATGTTTITFRTGISVGLAVVVVYKYGTSMIHDGFQREDSELPRIAIVPRSQNPQFMSIGEQSDGTGNWIYIDCAYTAQIRSRFAKQLKSIKSDLFNKLNQYRQLTPQPYKMVVLTVTSIIPQDFDSELRLYNCLVNYSVRWMVKFKD